MTLRVFLWWLNEGCGSPSTATLDLLCYLLRESVCRLLSQISALYCVFCASFWCFDRIQMSGGGRIIQHAASMSGEEIFEAAEKKRLSMWLICSSCFAAISIWPLTYSQALCRSRDCSEKRSSLKKRTRLPWWVHFIAELSWRVERGEKSWGLSCTAKCLLFIFFVLFGGRENWRTCWNETNWELEVDNFDDMGLMEEVFFCEIFVCRECGKEPCICLVCSRIDKRSCLTLFRQEFLMKALIIMINYY